jgi:hypothetical protein
MFQTTNQYIYKYHLNAFFSASEGPVKGHVTRPRNRLNLRNFAFGTRQRSDALGTPAVLQRALLWLMESHVIFLLTAT